MNFHLFWRDPGATRRHRTAVSLHSHTLYSRETLAFIPRIARYVPFLDRELERQASKYKAESGRELDYDRAWWTPPLAPQAALEVERRQINERCGLEAIVSLTDHDTIDGVMQLQVLHRRQQAPVSVEWTVPVENTFLHIGMHNLPGAEASTMMAAMAEFTRHPDPARLPDLFTWFTGSPETLAVFNHPFWDESGIGSEQHRRIAHEFLQRHKPWLHAAELNGLRPWKENREVIRFAAESGLPIISGGDRHAREPNSCLNLTNAASFAEFAAEVRAGRSEVLFMPQYRQPHGWRVMQHLLEIVGDDPDHAFGWRRWCDRCFYLTRNGETKSLGELWPNGGPIWVRTFIRLTELVRHRSLQPALRRAFGTSEESLL
ncbi:MAG: hypothetical protein SFV51_02600 [Bryobacteraceae bacterium]|nr:hypothetical protein [Bryobacteraceae bacterium]